MYLTERKLFFSVNHVFSGLTGSRDDEDFRCLPRMFPRLKRATGKCGCGKFRSSAPRKAAGQSGIAGSDSHTIAGVGRTYTEVRAREPPRNFLPGCEQAAA